MSEVNELKACVNCIHHVSSSFFDYCTLHRIETVCYTQGTRSSHPRICEFAREDKDLCGPDAKDYVHRGPEPEMSFRDTIKDFFKLLVT